VYCFAGDVGSARGLINWCLNVSLLIFCLLCLLCLENIIVYTYCMHESL
jgi:hypothetical protein